MGNKKEKETFSDSFVTASLNLALASLSEHKHLKEPYAMHQNIQDNRHVVLLKTSVECESHDLHKENVQRKCYLMTCGIQ